MSEDLTHETTTANPASGASAGLSTGFPTGFSGGGHAPAAPAASPGPATGAPALGSVAAPSGAAAGTAAAGAAAGSPAADPTASAGLLSAPDSYQPFTLPEGMTVDDGLLGQFQSVAAGLGLSQQQAQQLIDLRVEQARQEAAAHAAQSQQWADAARRDREFGGPGFQTALAVADRGLAAFATPELRALLDQTGLGNHPEVIRLAYRIGRTVAEPRPVQPGAVPSEAMSTADYYAREVFGG